ncbi:MAG: hypothetical protein P8Q26_17065 [Ascidiaceihabitans sp.]|nr:hypothetical protein [Ascidiaceihabitans sp.]
MLKTREMLTAAGTLACAVGIGFIIHSGDTAKQRYSDVATANAPAEIAPSIVDANIASAAGTLLEVQDITLTSAQTDTSDVIVTPETGVQLASASALVTPKLDTPVPAASCEISAAATASKGAMIDVELAAPCMPNEHVTVHHNGIMFSQSTALDGSLSVSVPAMSEEAVVIFAFPNGEGAVAQVSVPDLGQYDRTAIQWKGDTGFEMHAREFGADYGQEGHVWAGATRDVAAVDSAQGFLTRLGIKSALAPLMAEVYTFPTAMGTQDGTIDLSVEAEVTLMNCGLEIEAQSLELQGGQVKTQDLTLAVPECDAKGSFLVLNNLVQDLTVASN